MNENITLVEDFTETAEKEVMFVLDYDQEVRYLRADILVRL